jgi:hypothetical protein
MYHIPQSDKTYFSWDTPKPMLAVNSSVVAESDLDDIFGEKIVPTPKPKPKPKPKTTQQN